MYFTILLVIHVLGAIVGLGPTFAFSVLGPLAGKDQAHAVAYLGAIMAIQKRLVKPVALFTQPVSGVLLIFESGRNTDFFRHEWLVIAIVLFAAILYLGLLVDEPAIHRLVNAMKSGEVGTPQFAKDLKTTKTLGPLFGIMTVTIIILMVWKPGDYV